MTPATPTAALRACGVRVPCSTSNLGSGFDCIGLAFNRYLDAGYEPGTESGQPLQLRRAGTLAGLDIDIDDDIMVAAFRAELLRRGYEQVGGTVLMTSTIPIGRGLGSSGAAVVAGIALAAAACGSTLDPDAALASAVRLEGHPDNAAPALLGGLVTIAYADHGVPLARRLPLSDRIGFAFAAPDQEVSTQRARTVLPQHVPHSAAVRNLGRVASLLYGLANADPTSVAIGFHDELHVPYRLPLITGATAALKAAQDAGAWGATISGSGSGIVAACAAGAETRVLDAMLAAFNAAGAGGDGFVAHADAHGVQPRAFSTLRNALGA